MNRILTYKPPRIAMALTAVSALIAFISPEGTVMYLPYPFLGIVLILAGLVVMLRAWVSFRRAATAICPTDASTVLVTGDIYRATRNPMYLGMLAMVLGVAFMIGDPVVFAAPFAFFLIIDKVFIPYEEEDLRKTFGEQYEQYARRTRRWLV